MLEELVKGEPYALIPTHNMTPPLRRDAINYLADKMALEDVANGSYRLTAFGRDLWNEFTSPVQCWLKKNGFAATVAAATFLASAGGIVVNVVFKLLD